MKKILSLSLALIMMMALVGCDNFNAKDQEDVNQELQIGGVPNPFSTISNNEIFNEEIGINIDAPQSATNIEYSIHSNEIAQISYDLDEKRFVLRASKTISGKELSGIHGDFYFEELDAKYENGSVTISTAELDDGSAYAISVVQFEDKDTIYLALSTTNEILGNDITAMINIISHSVIEGNTEKIDQEIVGDARLITDEELTYFNETYFNAVIGQNINIANQFLHGEFATPQDIDLYNLFYLGTGAEYAMSEEGEYEAVANTFGFDTWLELPTDVTPSPVSAMDYILNLYTGTSFEDSNKVGLDNYKYLEEYDCYYHMHGDTNYYGNVEFTSGTVKGDTYHLQYHNPIQNDFEGADYILTLTKSDENYLIQSNLPMMIEEWY